MELPQNINDTNEINENKEKDNDNSNNKINENEQKDNDNSNNKINEKNNELELVKKKSELSDNNLDDYYDDNYDDYEEIDYVEKGQEEILESMFLKAKNSENENKISLYLDIISSDESKEKRWSYKCYQEICLIYMQFEDHYMFSLYYKQLMNAARTFDNKKLRPYVEATVTAFLNEIKSHCKESINHWLEDLTIDFNRLEQDKVINMFEANFNLKYLIL